MSPLPVESLTGPSHVFPWELGNQSHLCFPDGDVPWASRPVGISIMARSPRSSGGTGHISLGWPHTLCPLAQPLMTEA